MTYNYETTCSSLLCQQSVITAPRVLFVVDLYNIIIIFSYYAKSAFIIYIIMHE